VEKITLTPKRGFTLLYRGESAYLTAGVSPENASDQGLTWKSSNTKVAAVKEGEVLGRSAGKVKITATAVDGSGIAGEIILVVGSPEKSIKLNRASAVIYWNGSDALKKVALTAAASPKGTQYRGLKWSVVSGDAAEVDESTGVVTAVREGTATIRATTEQDHSAECAVTVRTLPETFALKTTEKTLAFRGSFDLGAEALFDAACTERALTWESKNSRVATVSAAGVVKASSNRTGTAVITATSKDGRKAQCTVTVVRALPKGAAGGIAALGAGLHIGLRLAGGNYATGDDRVAEVAGDGEVTLKRDGTAMLEAGGRRIAVKAADGEPIELTLGAGTELLLTSDARAEWSVKDDGVASIDKDGRLTALGEGETTVTAEAESGEKREIRITVRQSAEERPAPESGPAPVPTAESEPAPAPEPTAEPEPPIPEPASEPTPAPGPSIPEPTPPSQQTAPPEPTAPPGPTAAPEPAASPEAAPPKPQPAPDAPTDTGAAG